MSNQATVCTVYGDIRRTEESFLMSDYVYGAYNSAATLMERWLFVLMYVPAMRGRHVYDEWDVLNPILQAGYTSKDPLVILATLELILLRIQFYDVLREANLGLMHQVGFEFEAGSVWRDRLYDRYTQTTGAHFKKKGYVPPHVPDEVEHRWLH